MFHSPLIVKKTLPKQNKMSNNYNNKKHKQEQEQQIIKLCEMCNNNNAVYLTIEKNQSNQVNVVCPTCQKIYRNQDQAITIRDLQNDKNLISNWPVLEDYKPLCTLQTIISNSYFQLNANTMINRINDYFEEKLNEVQNTIKEMQNNFIKYYQQNILEESIKKYQQISCVEELKNSLNNSDNFKEEISQIYNKTKEQQKNNQQIIQELCDQIDEAQKKFNEKEINEKFDSFINSCKSITQSSIIFSQNSTIEESIDYYDENNNNNNNDCETQQQSMNENVSIIDISHEPNYYNQTQSSQSFFVRKIIKKNKNKTNHINKNNEIINDTTEDNNQINNQNQNLNNDNNDKNNDLKEKDDDELPDVDDLVKPKIKQNNESVINTKNNQEQDLPIQINQNGSVNNKKTGIKRTQSGILSNKPYQLSESVKQKYNLTESNSNESVINTNNTLEQDKPIQTNQNGSVNNKKTGIKRAQSGILSNKPQQLSESVIQKYNLIQSNSNQSNTLKQDKPINTNSNEATNNKTKRMLRAQSGIQSKRPQQLSESVIQQYNLMESNSNQTNKLEQDKSIQTNSNEAKNNKTTIILRTQSGLLSNRPQQLSNNVIQNYNLMESSNKSINQSNKVRFVSSVHTNSIPEEIEEMKEQSQQIKKNKSELKYGQENNINHSNKQQKKQNIQLPPIIDIISNINEFKQIQSITTTNDQNQKKQFDQYQQQYQQQPQQSQLQQQNLYNCIYSTRFNPPQLNRATNALFNKKNEVLINNLKPIVIPPKKKNNNNNNYNNNNLNTQDMTESNTIPNIKQVSSVYERIPENNENQQSDLNMNRLPENNKKQQSNLNTKESNTIPNIKQVSSVYERIPENNENQQSDLNMNRIPENNKKQQSNLNQKSENAEWGRLVQSIVCNESSLNENNNIIIDSTYINNNNNDSPVNQDSIIQQSIYGQATQIE